MKIVIAEFHQETNSFNPVPYKMDDFRRSGIYEGEQIFEDIAGKPCALAGMVDAIEKAGAKAIPAISMFSQSGGAVDHDVVDYFLQRVRLVIEAHAPVDGVFLSLHGATTTTLVEDCSGYILHAIREVAGEKAVIAASTDLHANITPANVELADIICGYWTYPHQDHYETGSRAAKLGMARLTESEAAKPKMVRVSVPMIVPASTYSTLEGPFKELIEEAQRLLADGEVQDFSIYQMQPWLDIEDAGSAVLVIDSDLSAAEKHARYLAEKLYSLRHSFRPKLRSIDEVIDLAASHPGGRPVILVDSADSSNAGATGDSAAVIARLLERGSNVKAACLVTDAPAAELAHAVGVGKRAKFTLGGSIYPEMNPPVQVEAYVKSLHDGVFTQEGPAGRGFVMRAGPTAVLQVGSIDILVCRQIVGNGDLQLYRGFGIEPTFYQLVVVKACTSHKVAYGRISDHLCETDTPGAAGLNLRALPFRRLPRHFYPLADADNDKVSIEVTVGRM